MSADVLAEVAALTPEMRERVLREWRVWARREQLAPPGDWRVWLILAGRGWGKSRTGAEWVRSQVASGRARRIALVARTASDVRDVIVEGESGLLAIHRADERPVWEPSRRRLTWPNGAIATTYTAEEPDQLRGPQHDLAWCDELASWRYPDAWDQLRFGLRLGDDPRCVVTTTPRPTPIIKALLSASKTAVTRGRSRDNARNLAPGVIAELEARYAGSRLGRQELDGEVLDDAAGALWRWQWIDAARVTKAPDMRRVVVAVDPAATSGDDSDETGIVVAGLGFDGRGYVLADESGRYRPEEWARRVASAYREHKADAVIAEGNQGGDMIGAVLRACGAAGLPVRTVHARRNKTTRAEPVAVLYEQGRISHVGALARLEDQLTTWDASTAHRSPDRLDALVYALTELIVDRNPVTHSAPKLISSPIRGAW